MQAFDGMNLMKLLHKEVRPQKAAAVELSFSVSVGDILNGRGDLPVKPAIPVSLVDSDPVRPVSWPKMI